MGAGALGDAAQGVPHPLRVVATPLAWLQRTVAGERPIMVVDWGRAWDALGPLSGLVADSVELGEMLDRWVRPPRLPRPKITVDGEGD